jgi:hypothetical protein
MTECVSCAARIHGPLFKTYSPGNVSLFVCASCGNVADPYVEQDWVLQSLDLALLKMSVMTHLLCNEPNQTWLILRSSSVLFLVECFVRARRLLAESPKLAPLVAVEAVVIGVFVRAVFFVFASFLLCWSVGLRFKSRHAPLSAYLIGSIVPVIFDGLSMVWDYQSLFGSQFVVQALLVASRATALSVVTLPKSWFCHVCSLVLTVLTL